MGHTEASDQSRRWLRISDDGIHKPLQGSSDFWSDQFFSAHALPHREATRLVLWLSFSVAYRLSEWTACILMWLSGSAGLQKPLLFAYEPAHDKTYNKLCDQLRFRSDYAYVQSD